MAHFSLRRPEVGGGERLALNYDTVGMTAAEGVPAGHRRHRVKARIGTGEEWFRRAGQAMLTGRMFELGWVTLGDAPLPSKLGQQVTVIARVGPVWVRGPLEVIHLVDESGSTQIAFGTLGGHTLIGEERFSLELDPQRGAVTFTIDAISRPAASMGIWTPIIRLVQARFRRAATDAIAGAARPPRLETNDPNPTD